MINILHLVNGWPSGGIIEQCYLACKYLPKDKFKHITIGFTHFDGSFVKKMEYIGVPCLHSDREYSRLKEVIDEYKIDIVHTQTGGGEYESYIPKLKEWGIPVIHSLHCPRACAIPIDEVDIILYTTKYTLDKNTAEYQAKMKPIQYSLDLDSPIRDVAHIRHTGDSKNFPIKVGRLGRIIPEKRPDVLVALAHMCLQAYGTDVQFHIAGMIPQDNERNIEHGKFFLESIKDMPNIVYSGFVEDKYDFWKTLDVCINPVWETSFDIVFLEAMACGIPILTWENSAAPYVVQGAGVVTSPNNGSLFCGLHFLLNKEQARKDMGSKGIEYIKEQYSLEKFVDAHTNNYEDVYSRSK